MKDWTLWKRDGDTVSFVHPRLFTRSHSCLLFLWTGYDSGFVYFPLFLVLQISIPVSFRSNLFPSFYWSYSGTSYLSIFFLLYTLSEDSSDDSSELVSHQMAHPSLCRTRFPS